MSRETILRENEDRRYVRCKCGHIYALFTGPTEGHCRFVPCQTAASSMTPATPEDLERVPAGSTIICLEVPDVMAAESRYLLCKCGWVHVAYPGTEDGHCSRARCDGLASRMTPIAADQVSRHVPEGSTIQGIETAG